MHGHGTTSKDMKRNPEINNVGFGHIFTVLKLIRLYKTYSDMAFISLVDFKGLFMFLDDDLWRTRKLLVL